MWGNIGENCTFGEWYRISILNVRYKNIMTNSTILTLFFVYLRPDYFEIHIYIY